MRTFRQQSARLSAFWQVQACKIRTVFQLRFGGNDAAAILESVRWCLESRRGQPRLKRSARPPLQRGVPPGGPEAGTDAPGMMHPFHLTGRSWPGRAAALYFARAPILSAKINTPNVPPNRSAAAQPPPQRYPRQLLNTI